MRVKIKLDNGAYMPERAHRTDAGADLRTPYLITIEPHSSEVIDTGVHIELPRGYYGRLESKSGLNVKDSVVSCGGTIDEGYTGSIRVKLYNFGNKQKTFDVGDKIVQLLICPVEYCGFCEVDELENTDRGDNGFGSTGR